MSDLKIIEIQNPKDSLISTVHGLFAKEFGKEELEPIDIFRKGVELTALGKHSSPFIFLVAMMGDKIIGGLTGNYLRLKNRATDAGAIGYCVVERNARGIGIGRATVDRFLDLLFAYSSKEGKSLGSVILEAQTQSEEKPNFYDSRPFWSRLGWKIPEGAKYLQPSLKFSENGRPEFDPVPLTFMIRQINGSDLIQKQDFLDIVKTLFDNWYVPDRSDLSKVAHRRACGHVYGLLGAFLNSLRVQANGNIRLMHYLPR
jgi:hypothetical protein